MSLRRIGRATSSLTPPWLLCADVLPTSFDYEGFFEQKISQKRTDNSYRVFNDINRLAERFPKARTPTLPFGVPTII
ncbi:hypothetical protein SARC_11672 [Sphaeroforma arctica JP610]|uniref:Uncharacterized protein n=1 Tax=Sphaeroforma arctica JP610 TaxID=667725 RepID=A0A0L0FGB4_9EUKA|nr:hypothetical protein SARC_11672 [Sphaeroforma arctica JP610]KNC75810.1 hypothetical protein SARC_11672 [Sphaeroforma arctica JP610]|eukprot:XP_014149712.1 hypothetical protein SARC_11672 [Sphaeroforma arctica JP610]